MESIFLSLVIGVIAGLLANALYDWLRDWRHYPPCVSSQSYQLMTQKDPARFTKPQGVFLIR